MVNRPGDRFTPNEGEWEGVGGQDEATTTLMRSAEEVIRAFLRAEPLTDTGSIRIPKELRAPAPGVAGIEWRGNGPGIRMIRRDLNEGLIDLVGDVECVEIGAQGFMLTVDPMNDGTQQLWGVPVLVP